MTRINHDSGIIALLRKNQAEFNLSKKNIYPSLEAKAPEAALKSLIELVKTTPENPIFLQKLDSLKTQISLDQYSIDFDSLAKTILEEEYGA